MAVSELKELYFSQSSLAIFQSCQKKFYYRYLAGLYWPAEWGMNEEIRQDLKLGQQFHLLAQRYYQPTLEETTLVSKQPLQAWLNRLKRFCPAVDIIAAEQELRLREAEFKLLAKYDLIKYDSSQARIIIYDWKTDKKDFKQKDIKSSMQTRFYLYLMVKAGYKYFAQDYKLETMPCLIYWNPRYPGQPVSLKYDKKSFEQDQTFFEELLKEILTSSEFPLTEDINKCRFCEYRPICRGKRSEDIEVFEEDLDLNLDWESVEEFEF